jgi:signal transduction histidine kinase/ActR/RegA family two-component response regulator
MPFFLKKRSIISLVVVFCLLVAAMAALAFLFNRQNRDAAAVHHTLTVQGQLTRVLSLLQDAETGQRGYLLTGNTAYLEPFTSATSELDKVVERLGLEVADNATQVQALATLRLVVNDKLDELLETIALKKASKSEEALTVVGSNKGKALMDRARDVLARMFAEEQQLLAAREGSSQQTYKWAVGGIAAAILITLALGWLTLVDAKRQFEIANNAENVARLAHQRTLDEVARRERLEDQLRQSQKMEAIGQLTGGIAHDFNNMLAVVIGSLNLLKRRVRRGESDNMRFIDGALDGAERAATLTHRLLAFSRQQPLTPQAVEPNKLISGMSEILRRTLGEHIAVETVLAGGLWRTHADPSQLESAILNLAVNGRDAMVGGGRLTIETANAYLDEAYSAQHLEVAAGQYVLLAVSDTGQGMPAEVLSKAFEPFFTTKGAGKGTGLGLSQVLGFVKQSGGHVKIYSEPDHGTTVKVYLPRFKGIAEELPVFPLEEARSGQRHEVVLVVEDEERMLQLSCDAFRELGYTVLHAAGPMAALRVIDAHPEITLLFTDVVMPEMNGRQLAREAILRLPNLKVLYTTGFSRNAVIHNGVLDPDVNFISKPFTIEQLAAKVRGVLDDAPVLGAIQNS